MNSRLQWVLGLGVAGTAFVLFFIYVYQPKAQSAMGTTRVEESLRPSARFYDQPVQFIPEFEFQTHRGDTLSRGDLMGKIAVVDFFFTTCDAACPGMSTQMSRVQKAFKSESDFRIISFSLDPEKDQIPVLKAYAERFGAVDNSWFFLRGSQSDIYALGQEGFLQALVLEDGVIDHSEKFVLVDRKGGIRGFYQGTEEKEVDKLINDIKYMAKLQNQNQ